MIIKHPEQLAALLGKSAKEVKAPLVKEIPDMIRSTMLARILLCFASVATLMLARTVSATASSRTQAIADICNPSNSVGDDPGAASSKFDDFAGSVEEALSNSSFRVSDFAKFLSKDYVLDSLGPEAKCLLTGNSTMFKDILSVFETESQEKNSISRALQVYLKYSLEGSQAAADVAMALFETFIEFEKEQRRTWRPWSWDTVASRFFVKVLRRLRAYKDSIWLRFFSSPKIAQLLTDRTKVADVKSWVNVFAREQASLAPLVPVNMRALVESSFFTELHELLDSTRDSGFSTRAERLLLAHASELIEAVLPPIGARTTNAGKFYYSLLPQLFTRSVTIAFETRMPTVAQLFKNIVEDLYICKATLVVLMNDVLK